jgi:hypothetical protein
MPDNSGIRPTPELKTQENLMKKPKFYTGIVCFVLAAILFLADITKWEFMAGVTNVVIYPAIFLLMMGVIFVALSWRKPTS